MTGRDGLHADRVWFDEEWGTDGERWCRTPSLGPFAGWCGPGLADPLVDERAVLEMIAGDLDRELREPDTWRLGHPVGTLLKPAFDTDPIAAACWELTKGFGGW